MRDGKGTFTLAKERDYRSLDQGRADGVRRVLSAGLESLLPGVPGFFVNSKDGERYWSFAGAGGLIFPILDFQRRKIALMVRSDKSDAKYLFCSSKKRDGAGPGSPVHFPLFDGDYRTVRVTEGYLKADLATFLSGVFTLGLSSVATWRQAATALALLKPEKVRVSFDADAQENLTVAQAQKNLVEDLTGKGYTIELERWELEDGKGIDDLLAAGKTPEIITGEEVFLVVADIEGKAAQGRSARKPSRNGDGRRAEASQTNGQSKPGGADPAEVHLTDRGNAIRLVQRHGHDLRYCHPWHKWFVWDGRRWRLDDNGGVMARAKETIAHGYLDTARQLSELAASLVGHGGSDAERENQKIALQRAVRHYLASEATKALRAMVESTQSEAGIPVLPNELDRNRMLLNVLNGTLDLRTGMLSPHRREDMITKLCPVEYQPEAKCPTWERFLGETFPATGDAAEQPGDTELIGFMRRVLGYCMTGQVIEQILLILWGSGSNGKSTLLNVLLDVLGEDYAIKGASDLLMVKRSAHPTERADLFGKRVVVCVETDEGQRFAESLLKDLTGGDRQRARRMKEDFWVFDPTHKLILCTNHKPVVKGTDHALWRRVRLVPFTVTVADERQDKQLVNKLRREYPGILAWMVRGCLEWQRSGLGQPDAVHVATAAYRKEQDLVAAFIADCCMLHQEYRCKASTLYTAFRRWCEENGVVTGKDIPSRDKFGDGMTRHEFTRKTSNGTWYLGLDLRHEEAVA